MQCSECTNTIPRKKMIYRSKTCSDICGTLRTKRKRVEREALRDDVDYKTDKSGKVRLCSVCCKKLAAGIKRSVCSDKCTKTRKQMQAKKYNKRRGLKRQKQRLRNQVDRVAEVEEENFIPTGSTSLQPKFYEQLEARKTAPKRRSKLEMLGVPDREEINKHTDEFLKKGGKIKRMDFKSLEYNPMVPLQESSIINLGAGSYYGNY